MRTASVVPLLVAGAFLTTAGPAGGQEDVRLESVNEGTSFRDLSYAPDGSTVAFLSRRSGTSKIWLIADDGSDARILLDDDGSESELAWSPDGSRIAFVRSEGGQSDIWIVDRDGTGVERITDDAGGEGHLRWSPDGRRIAFLSRRGEHQDLFVVDLGSGEVRRLTEETNPLDEYRFAPAWSPDGAWIAYVSNRSDHWHQDLWLVDVGSGESRKLSADVDVMTSPVWSPDGRQIAFNAVRKHEFWWGDQSDIYVADVDDLGRLPEVRKLEMNTWVSDRNGSIRMAWSPDSESIYFRYMWEGDANLWRVSREGGVATKVTYEAGSFGNFSIRGDGEAVVYARSLPTRASELHRIDLSGGSPVRLTQWAPEYDDIQPPERISFRTTDGKHILGYLYLPPDFDPSARYPALVEVHGGGNNAYGNRYHILEHVLSHEGFVVLAIEYRGSAGHGRAFQRLSLGDWAAGQGWDAVAAARFLKSRPWSNGRVGIYGGSYGGIMSMAALTRDDDPFAAAAPLYGIYDWESAFEHGDYLMRFWIIEGHLGYKPGENPPLYERTASLRHLERVRTDLPFLVIHGEKDRRAPFQQSEELVDALRERGNPVDFYSYPEERHGFSRPDNRLHAYGHLIDFFQKHLGTVDGS